MIGLIGTNNETKIQGFIELEKINKKDNTRVVYKNTITNGGKQFLLAKSAATMLNMSADVFGEVVCSNMIAKTGANTNYIPSARQARKDRDINNVLLNLDENTLAGLGVSTSFVNIWDNTFENKDKVVGYANSDLNPTADGKEGIIDFCKGDYMVDPFTICKRWKYPEGVGTGKINCIGMMPGSILDNPGGDGIKFSKCIDKINTQYQNYTNMSKSFLIPGIPGYTANNEILLNFNKDGVNKWKYNIGTGEIVQVPDTDNFFVPSVQDSMILVDMQYIDNFLYTLELMQYSGRYDSVVVKVYDPVNGMAKVSEFNCAYINIYEYKTKASIFKVNNDLYISAISSVENTSEMNKLWKLTKGANGYATGATAYKDFSQLGIVVPAGLNILHISIGKYGDNYVLFNSIKLYDSLSSSKTAVGNKLIGCKMVGYVFTDITDPFNTIIDMIPGITPNEVLFATNSVKGTLRVGFDKYNSTSYFGDYYDLEQGKTIVMNNSSLTNKETITSDTTKDGVFLTLDKWWTNIFSFVKLNTPIEKTDTDILYVSYGYKIV